MWSFVSRVSELKQRVNCTSVIKRQWIFACLQTTYWVEHTAVIFGRNIYHSATNSNNNVFNILYLFQFRGFSKLFRVNVTRPVGSEKQKKVRGHVKIIVILLNQ